ncbi:nuclear protein UL55B [Testudinid alphaherpesvirus 3]|uniref:Nuclear protein UL55B n=1 Tax=Testudinid alphaherpesvirus 3 TaxID=2560801 RepID=A0A0K1R1E6_9ALPH|nr:nuclear protein UL55B [Testudinid alphaherpesvirus 3]AIU39329.1 nuclear protein UL55B [Testudinid alphaherpesvirus 3]AIU39424.1 nuclear protein UL55B [Testudinid alphaherpesvirus 3]AKI81699.1 nuclear protein UL55B [Testudinid alphaherpesvirus 3]AKV40734.1 UL55a protein [Testudinid alphaherpesvirus 3]
MAEARGPYVLGKSPMIISVKPGSIWNSETWTLYQGTYNALPAVVGFQGVLGRDTPNCRKRPEPVHFYFFPLEFADKRDEIRHTELVDYMCRFTTPCVKEVADGLVRTHLPNPMCNTPLFPAVIYPVWHNTVRDILAICVPHGAPGSYHQHCAIPCIGFHCHCEKPFGLYCRCLLKFVLDKLRPAVSDKCHDFIRLRYDYGGLNTRIMEFTNGECVIKHRSD